MQYRERGIARITLVLNQKRRNSILLPLPPSPSYKLLMDFPAASLINVTKLSYSMSASKISGRRIAASIDREFSVTSGRFATNLQNDNGYPKTSLSKAIS
ncbi:hypothetical protein CEXT_604341 [Caerostris extrusa]|uniref:Uncharacterized protein n=1 Tax=Caerostris extrusa TaxID=172846 RepID=A0AAV4MCV9_CAEEX|nr:hypothetical protein CEXT_604341 [Caerostris extrusa]